MASTPHPDRLSGIFQSFQATADQGRVMHSEENSEEPNNGMISAIVGEIYAEVEEKCPDLPLEERKKKVLELLEAILPCIQGPLLEIQETVRLLLQAAA